MKNYLVVLFFVVSSQIFSQNTNDKVVYLDSLWQETKNGNHKYYRIIKDYAIEQNLYKIYDYYKNGKIQMEGSTENKENLMKIGEYIYYYENGNKESIVNYNKLAIPIGEYRSWYENGNRKAEGEYLKNEKLEIRKGIIKINQFWDIDGNQKVINGNGDYYEETIEINNKKDFSKGKVINGLKDGVWTGIYENYNFSFKEIYKNGALISGVSTDSNSTQHEYTVVEEMPMPKKGYSHFSNFIAKKMKLPKVNNSVNGRVFLEFIIEKDGKIVDIKVLKGLDKQIDQAAIDVLNIYKNWNTGKLRGIPRVVVS